MPERSVAVSRGHSRPRRRKGTVVRMENCEPARQAKASGSETLFLNAQADPGLTGEEGPERCQARVGAGKCERQVGSRA